MYIFLFLNTLNILHHLLLASMVSDEKAAVFCSVLPYGKVMLLYNYFQVLSLSYFQYSDLVFNFYIFNYDESLCGFIGVYYFWILLAFFSSFSIALSLLPNLGIFFKLLFLHIFLELCSFLLIYILSFVQIG